MHRRCLTDDLGRLHVRCGHACRLLAALVDGTAYERNRLVDVERFRQVFESTATIRGDGAVQVGVRGDHDDGNRRSLVVDQIEQLDAAQTRHANVGDDRGRGLALKQRTDALRGRK